MNVLDRIVEERKRRIASAGHCMGTPVPSSRTVPLVPFGADPFLICEIKRHSPSKGDIAPGLDAVGQARAYADQGIRNLSVLTEQDNFGGSLEDIIRIKSALPDVSVLRKDFLLDEEDIEVSWRAGADAVLLIASILDHEKLAALYRKATALGLRALVEVHSEEDVDKGRSLAPELTGINSRDLSTFSVDLAHPIAMKTRVDWKTRLIFESGIKTQEDVLLALGSGFAGVLVGEAAVRSPQLVAGFLDAFGKAARQKPGDFWQRLFSGKKPGKPFVKVCGITRPGDAWAAAELGADALGFVFAQSSRRASSSLLETLRALRVPKVAVVVTAREGGKGRLDDEVRNLLDRGLLDAVQFHGDEAPEECASLAFPYYKAVRVNGTMDVEEMDRFLCPRVLADSYSVSAAGGTGQVMPKHLARQIRSRRPLWLAGGIGPDNAGEILRGLEPELIDASSRLEESPGVKDPGRLSRFFQEIERHAVV